MGIPRRKADYEQAITNAFIAGCQHGYGVDHTVDMRKQEELGALLYIGKISDEEFEQRLLEIQLAEMEK